MTTKPRWRPRLKVGRRAAIAGIAALWLAAIVALVGIGGMAYSLVRPRPTPLQVRMMPPLPKGWASTLQLGMSSGPDQAAAMQQKARFGLRYQYLAGGVNTGGGWATWKPDGSFVTSYVQESQRQQMMPVFTYYMLTQSAPGRGSGPNEPDAVRANVSNRDTMRAYFEDLRLFFQKAGAEKKGPIVLHVEPDLWGFLHQQANGDDAARVPLVVGSAGLPELADLPDDLRGFAQAVVRLRDRSAPNALLGYHVSAWGSGTDPFISNSSDATVDDLARREAAFYYSLGANFDFMFAEFSDRDAGFRRQVYGDKGRSWWDADDFNRHLRFLSRIVDETGKRIVLWQIPYGNTRMRVMDNTWNHFQDNRVEWLLDDGDGEHLRQYMNAGVIALLFGRGADGATDASDAAKDGIADPPPINGNDRPSLNADDDGGYFGERAAAYYRGGPLQLP
jgi:hypothetical protein